MRLGEIRRGTWKAVIVSNAEWGRGAMKGKSLMHFMWVSNIIFYAEEGLMTAQSILMRLG